MLTHMQPLGWEVLPWGGWDPMHLCSLAENSLEVSTEAVCEIQGWTQAHLPGIGANNLSYATNEKLGNKWAIPNRFSGGEPKVINLLERASSDELTWAPITFPDEEQGTSLCGDPPIFAWLYASCARLKHLWAILSRGSVLISSVATQKKSSITRPWHTLRDLSGFSAVTVHSGLRRPLDLSRLVCASVATSTPVWSPWSMLLKEIQQWSSGGVIISGTSSLGVCRRMAQNKSATDASCDMGAICVTTPPPHVAEVLWKACKSKGSYTRLLSPAEVLLKRLDAFEEVSSQAFEVPANVPRPLAYTFDFLEVYAGSAKVTKFMQELGVSTGPPIDISFSPELDLTRDFVMHWVSHLICHKLIKALMCEPPCTTFSIRRFPPLRSKAQPYGFQPKDEKTQQGNQLAVRGCQMICLCHRYEIAGLIEKPLTSLLQHLPAWKTIAGLPNSSQVRTDSCRFGSIHRKSFKFLGVHLCLDELALQCQCTSKHVPVEGAYTKASAIYVDDLARALASTLEKGIRRINGNDRDLGSLKTKGLENQLVNEVAQGCTWKEVASWKFKKESHINILEEAALLRQASCVARDGRSKRVVNLVDSNVVRCASAKGRSSSLGLSTILRRFWHPSLLPNKT